jgi:hypothetical protein
MRPFPPLLALLAACAPATAALLPAPPADTDDPGADPDASYEAEALATALDRLVVRRFPNDGGRCAFVTFVSPAWAGPFDVRLPAEWGVEGAAASDVDDCLTWHQGSDYVAATAAVGWADWTVDPGSGLADRLDLDIDFAFEDGDRIRFVATGLQVAR